MADRVLVEILVAAPIDVVWKALREPAEVIRWFGWQYPNLLTDTEGMWADTKEDAAKRTLYSDGQPDRFTVEAVGNQTIVRVIRSAPAEDAGWSGIYDDVFEGWTTFFQQLKFALERHRGQDRATLFLNGRAKDAATSHPIDAMGLAPLWVVPAGERYRVQAKTGDTLEGTIYFRSPYQLGLTVDGVGDGLLILAIRPRTEKSPHGGGTVLLTTYGMKADALAALRKRWSEWWKQTYEVIEIQPATSE
jgi:hypothetical protein